MKIWDLYCCTIIAFCPYWYLIWKTTDTPWMERTGVDSRYGVDSRSRTVFVTGVEVALGGIVESVVVVIGVDVLA